MIDNFFVGEAHAEAKVYDELFDAKFAANWYLAERDAWRKRYTDLLATEAQLKQAVSRLGQELQDQRERGDALAAQVIRQNDQIDSMAEEARALRLKLQEKNG